MKSNTKHIAILGILIAAATAVHYIEGLLPSLILGVPIKLGLANIFTLYTLIKFSRRDALILTVLRSILGSFLSGAISGMLYSLTGGMLAFLAMSMLLELYIKKRISAIGMSVCGSFFFYLGQLVVGSFLNGPAMLLYFPMMSILSIPTGFFVGLITTLMLTKLPDIRKE